MLQEYSPKVSILDLGIKCKGMFLQINFNDAWGGAEAVIAEINR
jgi:hypothetical protein